MLKKYRIALFFFKKEESERERERERETDRKRERERESERLTERDLTMSCPYYKGTNIPPLALCRSCSLRRFC